MNKVDVPALTGLRGLAALWVVGYHFNLWLPLVPLPYAVFHYGFLGVDVFFVLSGYLLANLHIDMMPTGWGAFFRRRIFRVYPLHIAVMAALAVLVLFREGVGGVYVNHYEWEVFPYVLSLTQIFAGVSGWNDPSWSVGAELVSYLVLPLAIPVLRRSTVPVAAAFCAILLAADVALIADTAVPLGASLITPIFGLHALMRGLLGFFTGAVFARCIGLADLRLGLLGWVLSWGPVFWLGDVSYSIYLLHGPILSIFKHLLPSMERHGVADALMPLALVLILAGASVTHRWIEVPAIRFGRKQLVVQSRMHSDQ